MKVISHNGRQIKMHQSRDSKSMTWLFKSWGSQPWNPPPMTLCRLHKPWPEISRKQTLKLKAQQEMAGEQSRESMISLSTQTASRAAFCDSQLFRNISTILSRFDTCVYHHYRADSSLYWACQCCFIYDELKSTLLDRVVGIEGTFENNFLWKENISPFVQK